MPLLHIHHVLLSKVLKIHTSTMVSLYVPRLTILNRSTIYSFMSHCQRYINLIKVNFSTESFSTICSITWSFMCFTIFVRMWGLKQRFRVFVSSSCHYIYFQKNASKRVNRIIADQKPLCTSCCKHTVVRAWSRDNANCKPRPFFLLFHISCVKTFFYT